MNLSNGHLDRDLLLSPELRERLARSNYDAKMILEMTDQIAKLSESKGIIVLGEIVCSLLTCLR
jgi:hypothetical protein